MTKAADMMAPDAALIYCRVSTRKQDDEGSGLDSQEHRCREKAQQLGCPVEAVFPDTVSGGGDFMERPGMVDLMAHLDANPDKRYVVIFDDLKRYSRDTEFHLTLRREMMKRDAIRICLNFEFSDTPEGKFLETILAATGTLEREQNARQVKQKMLARLQQGYWVFHAPKGYTYERAKGGGKIVVPDEPLASIVKEALEGYASRRLESQAEVKRYLEAQPHFPKDRLGNVPQQRVTDLLTNPFYAGYIRHERFGLNWLKAQHDPLISLETFERIQERRTENTKAPARKNLNRDFPLRGFVNCADCGNPLTACWSKGKAKKYPYYLCDTRGCDSYRKSIRRERIEGEFADIVQSLQHTRELFDFARTMFVEAFRERSEKATARREALKAELIGTEKEIEGLLHRVVSATNERVIAAHENRIGELEIKRRILDEKLAQKPPTRATFDTIIEHGFAFLASLGISGKKTILPSREWCYDWPSQTASLSAEKPVIEH